MRSPFNEEYTVLYNVHLYTLLNCVHCPVHVYKVIKLPYIWYQVRSHQSPNPEEYTALQNFCAVLY